mgnify:CR=1 FL=1|jgi:hypothetical protein
MPDKPDLMTEKALTPEAIAENSFFTRADKLARLTEMKRELVREAARDNLGLDDIEGRAAAIDQAIRTVKAARDDGKDGIVAGRLPTA